MNKFHFSNKLRGIYAAFGKAYPGTSVAEAIFKRVESMPDGFMDYALERLENQPDMPKNLGYHLRHALWPEYLEKHPQLKATESQGGCHNCSPDMPGFFWAWEADGKRYCLKCACNPRSDLAHIQPWTPRMAVDAGLRLSDPAMDGHAAPRYLPPSARKALGHKETPRSDHLREAAYADAENW
ncbi:hypothetical protein [Desulfovibrio sp. SGI.169]|uniref:hypothetical protein n=1 Tax=Desulfovibrio sp. SGI.169 TaxID=3420561 RepID=UPI003D06F5A9